MRHTPLIATVWIVGSVLVSPSWGDVSTTQRSFSTTDETWHDVGRNRDVPIRLYLPAVIAKPSPTILLSHGLGDTKLAMAYAADVWAEHGYVVVALQHIGSDDSIWKNVPAADRFKAIFRAASVDQFVLRCDDVHFALDELNRRNGIDGNLKGRIDVDHIGLAGHSFGALTTQAIIGQKYAAPDAGKSVNPDSRIKAAVIMSPGIEGLTDPTTAFANVHVPTFHVTGTVDVVAGLGYTPASKRRVPFDGMTGSDRYLLTFDRGDHMVFSGHRPAGVDDARYDHVQAETAKWTTDFWDATLRDDKSARAALENPTLSAGDRFEHKPATTQPSQ